MPIRRIDIGAAYIEAGVVVSRNQGGVGRQGAAVEFIPGVQHQLRAAEVEPHPIAVVRGAGRGRAEYLKAQYVAVEAERSGHVVDLDQGAKALHVDWHGTSISRVAAIPGLIRSGG